MLGRNAAYGPVRAPEMRRASCAATIVEGWERETATSGTSGCAHSRVRPPATREPEECVLILRYAHDVDMGRPRQRDPIRDGRRADGTFEKAFPRLSRVM